MYFPFDSERTFEYDPITKRQQNVLILQVCISSMPKKTGYFDGLTIDIQVTKVRVV